MIVDFGLHSGRMPIAVIFLNKPPCQRLLSNSICSSIGVSQKTERNAAKAASQKQEFGEIHMRKPQIITFAILTIAMTTQAAEPLTQATEVHEISVTATKYQFTPNPLRVKKGEHVKLVISAPDHDHGFKLEAFKINQKIKKGTTATVEFIADQPGEFPFQCSDFCGLGHGKMKGSLVVEE
jgi:cytochrome c oxidase subunit II